jgi:hypothetical protein
MPVRIMKMKGGVTDFTMDATLPTGNPIGKTFMNFILGGS